MTFTEIEIRKFLDEQFGGVVAKGKHQKRHEKGGKACVLEAYSQMNGMEWTDDPVYLGTPDIRPLNDAEWPSAAARTEAMIPLLAAVSGWKTWDTVDRVSWSRRVAERTIREVLPIALRAVGLEDAAVLCETHGDAKSARAAAISADSDALADLSIWACNGVAESARSASDTSTSAEGRSFVLNLACRIQIEEAEVINNRKGSQ